MPREPSEPDACGGSHEGLLRIVYLSQAARRLKDDELAALEALSRARNDAAAISGLLMAQGPFFYGIMEGPQEELLDRMEVIITDPRHTGLRILREQQSKARRLTGFRLFRLPELEGAAAAAHPPRLDFILDLARRLK